MIRHLACAVGLGAVLVAAAASATEGPKVTNGGYLQTAGDTPVPLPLKHTDVQAEISGFVASVQVTQQFGNPSKKPIEAVYVFPLPHRSAVFDMTIQVGKRTIKGVVQKRADARRTYEKARSQGKTAALLEQERPNIFTQSIANILPGDDIKVAIRYVEDLLPEDGRYEFAFPMVVGPRYVGGGEALPAPSGTGWGKDTTRIGDASRITPHLLAKGLRPGHDIALRLKINAGVAVQHVQVLAHKAQMQTNGNMAEVVLDKQDSIPNKDFVVRYQLAGRAPAVAVLTHRDARRGGHVLLMIQPKAKMNAHEVAPREYIFVIDKSGSQEGFPLEQSKAAVRKCLASVGPRDTFNLIAFESGVSSYAPKAVPATPRNVDSALSFLHTLSGGGGTEFIPALRLALGAPRDPSRSRIVLFMTDGYIGYEAEVLKYLRANARGTNLFPLGVGSSVNRFLIDGMARIGVGMAFYLLNTEKPTAVVERIFSTISKPALTSIAIDWGKLDVERMTPSSVPDLFGEQPVFVAARYRVGGKGMVTVRGQLAGKPFQQQVAVELPPAGKESDKNLAVAYLWARRQIADWSDLEAIDPPAKKQTEASITSVALRYNLMSQYTSLVAVDQVVRNRGGKQETVPVPVPLPDGVSDKAAPPHAYKGASDALGGLIGNQIGEAYGVGGLGLSGSAHGGGGTGAGLGTLGTIGRGGGGGTGSGYGGRLAGRSYVMPRLPMVSAASVVVQGSLDKDLIRRIIRRHVNEVKYCYAKELQSNPKLAGRVAVRFEIGPDGLVVLAEVATTTLDNAAVEQCLVQAVRRWSFPKVDGGGRVIVTYPFVFQPAVTGK